MRAWFRYVVPGIAGLFALSVLLSARALLPDPFQRLQSSVFDSLQRLRPWQPPDTRVRVVLIDDESLKRLGQWPWSRDTMAEIVRNLQDAGAKAIGFDVLFAEPDRTSPSNLADAWRARYGWSLPEAALPDHDAKLAEAFARGSVVTGFALLPAENGLSPTIGTSIAAIGGNPALRIRSYKGAIPNLPVLEAAASGQGTFSIAAEQDEVIRRLPMMLAFNQQLVPSLATETLRVSEGSGTIAVREMRDAGAEGPVTGYKMRVGRHTVDLDAQGFLLLHHGARPAGLPAWQVIDHAHRKALRDEIEGRIVLIGASATALADLRPTPLNPFEPGVNLHARAIEQVLAQHMLARPLWASGAETLAAVASVVLVLLLVVAGGTRIAALGVAVLTITFTWGTAWLFAERTIVLDPSFAIITIVACFVIGGFTRHLVAERNAARLRSAFKHYLSPDMVERLARDPDRLMLGGEMREMTFVFTDLEGFTRFVETAEPTALVRLLNAYLDGMCQIAMAHGGTVDKIVGDALHVMFNAPLDQPDHAERAVRCAMAMDAFSRCFAAEQATLGVTFGSTRIGVNTGQAVVGNFGGRQRFDYTAHGDAINTAARLEAANKTLGTRICVSEATVQLVPAMSFLPLGTVHLKGKANGVRVFVPSDPEFSAWSQDYQNAYARLHQGDETAALSILRLCEAFPGEPVLALHAASIRQGDRSMSIAA